MKLNNIGVAILDLFLCDKHFCILCIHVPVYPEHLTSRRNTVFYVTRRALAFFVSFVSSSELQVKGFSLLKTGSGRKVQELKKKKPPQTTTTTTTKGFCSKLPRWVYLNVETDFRESRLAELDV